MKYLALLIIITIISGCVTVTDSTYDSNRLKSDGCPEGYVMMYDFNGQPKKCFEKSNVYIFDK